MKTDTNGCSTTKPGQEQWEEFKSSLTSNKQIQYDYRTPDGRLFSCVAKSLDAAHARRDTWLATIEPRISDLSDFVQKHCCGKQYDSCINSPCIYASVHGCTHPLHPRHQQPSGE